MGSGRFGSRMGKKTRSGRETKLRKEDEERRRVERKT